jgi:hypothetical protein
MVVDTLTDRSVNMGREEEAIFGEYLRECVICLRKVGSFLIFNIILLIQSLGKKLSTASNFHFLDYFNQNLF